MTAMRVVIIVVQAGKIQVKDTVDGLGGSDGDENDFLLYFQL